MARKCGRCREEGHTRATCPTVRVPLEETRAHSEEEPAGADPFAAPTKEPDPFDRPGPWFPAGFEQDCDGCYRAISAGDAIRADGSGGYECESCGEGEPPNLAVSGDHRKWCIRCKLLGHYASECTKAVLEGGVVSVPVLPGLTLTTHLYTDHSGVQWTHPGVREECELTECCLHPNGFGPNGCAGCGASRSDDPDNACSAADGYAPHAFEWNKWVSASQCVACGEDNPEQPDPFELPTQPGTVGQYLSEDPPLTGPLVDKARDVAEPDPFELPTQPATVVNVSGQPDARYEWYGKQNRGYLVKLPETGDFRRYKNGKPRGLTRATTFNKAATDQNSLTDWAKRNVLIGASKRPDLVAKAHGLTHEENRDQLMKLVAELETTAGAKVSADIGTLIHELTEQWDAGTITMADVPAAYQPMIVLYTATLQEAGLRPVPGLIERTTYIPEFGGVVGTLDRVYYHERSGQYVIGDVKTGKTLQYGMDEIETQEWIYAHGVNNAGVYDWNTDTWHTAAGASNPDGHPQSVREEYGEPDTPVIVSEEWGVVIHMPVQGPDAGKVTLVRADLQRGRRHAEVCHDVRVQRANKPKPEAWTGDEFGTQAMTPELSHTDWRSAFSTVVSKGDAAQLWQAAYDAGVPPEEMERLKGLADARLAELDSYVTQPKWEWSFGNVSSVESAGDLWERARKAGVEPLELGRLVGLAQQRLRELGISG